jgi:Flp pilus assembly protein TadB
VADDKKNLPSVSGLASRVFRVCALILGSVLVLNLAVACVQPILPWIVGCVVGVGGVWLGIAIIRWRRSRW